MIDLRAPSARLIIARAQSGERVALDIVLGALQGPLYCHIHAIVGDPDDARDALQEVLLIIARKLPALREVGWLRAWAYRIATRQAVRHTRTARRWREAVRGDEALNSLAAPEAEDAFARTAIADAPELIAALSPASEVVMRMHYLDGLTYAEISEALEIPLGTVKSRVAYGVAAIRQVAIAARAGR